MIVTGKLYKIATKLVPIILCLQRILPEYKSPIVVKKEYINPISITIKGLIHINIKAVITKDFIEDISIFNILKKVITLNNRQDLITLGEKPAKKA